MAPRRSPWLCLLGVHPAKWHCVGIRGAARVAERIDVLTRGGSLSVCCCAAKCARSSPRELGNDHRGAVRRPARRSSSACPAAERVGGERTCARGPGERARGTPRRRAASGWRPSAPPAPPTGSRRESSGCRSCGYRRTPPRRLAERAQRLRTSAPTGANTIAASSSCGGVWPSPRPDRPELEREVLRRRRRRARVNAYTSQPSLRATWTRMWAAAPNPYSPSRAALAAHPQRPISDQSRAHQRRGLRVGVAVRDRKAEALVRHCVLGHPASMSRPVNRARRHRFSRPLRQYSHSPQVQPSHGTPTRRPPIRARCRAHDVATIWWPRTRGG